MKKKKTERGFSYLEFKDYNRVKCNIQKSSLATSNAIWIGAEDIGLKRFSAGLGWQDVRLISTEKDHYVANNRMHLTQEQVANILPILQKFVETGEI